MAQLDFNKRSTDERIILKEVIKKLYDTTRVNVEYYFTDIEGTDIYDGYVMLSDKETGTIIKRHLMEIKIRDVHYNDLLLEKKKLTNLMNKAAESEADVLYISTTPKGSYIFNLTRLENENGFDWVQEQHNKTTTDLSQGKITKTVTYLSVEHARYIPVKQTDIEVLKRLRDAERKVIALTKESQRKKNLFDTLFGNQAA